MKMMKKLATLLLAICLIFPCFATTVEAAEGVTFFTDLETKVGEKFNIDANVVVKGGVLGEAVIKLNYDTQYIRFIEGKGATDDGNGHLTLEVEGDGRSDRTVVKLQFQALKKGDTKINQVSETVKDKNGKKVECRRGYSAIKVKEGNSEIIEEPEKIGKTADVTVENKKYQISEAFTETSIPSGFVMGETSYKGETFKCAVNKKYKLKAVYLVNDSNEGKFWLYDEKKSHFSPVEEIPISDISSIIVLDGTEKVKMPVNYQISKININGHDFPVWDDVKKDGVYALYALNSDGEATLYCYDSAEHTYQRMDMPKHQGEKAAKTKLDKMTEFVMDHFVWVAVAVVCMIILLAVFLIVVSVKLYHRNVELDDLYDEYGIDLDEKEPTVNIKEKKQKQKPVKKKKEKETEIDWDDDFDDDYDDDDFDSFDDDYSLNEVKEERKTSDNPDDDLAELREDYESGSARKEYDHYYDDEDDFDDFDLEEKKEKVSKDETFEMDFIDLN